MRKAIVTALVSLALVIAPAWFAAPANASTTTAAIATTAAATTATVAVTAGRPAGLPVEPQAWQRAGEYSSEWMCLVAGAFGQVRGYWKDWNCYFSDYSGTWVLYVLV
ncbi:hypothetical protein [Allorhizocola rhizosphaerae]|uniref:hypothetical protein n=1 Tax=Allorhizocola rhizosphaerae TaxID=1872709 RepID=UPI000E3D2A8E|nr:hypothetical protein [Allorhizocola rhizosphaerae]